MDRENKKAMAYYLPEYTRIVKTPSPEVCCWDDTQKIKLISIETFEFKTTDIINAFCNLQIQALANASKELNQMKREEACHRIRNMVFFYDKVREYKRFKRHQAGY